MNILKNLITADDKKDYWETVNDTSLSRSGKEFGAINFYPVIKQERLTKKILIDKKELKTVERIRMKFNHGKNQTIYRIICRRLTSARIWDRAWVNYEFYKVILFFHKLRVLKVLELKELFSSNTTYSVTSRNCNKIAKIFHVISKLTAKDRKAFIFLVTQNVGDRLKSRSFVT